MQMTRFDGIAAQWYAAVSRGHPTTTSRIGRQMAAYQLARHRIVWWTVLCSLQLTRPVNSDPGIKGMTPFPIFGW